MHNRQWRHNTNYIWNTGQTLLSIDSEKKMCTIENSENRDIRTVHTIYNRFFLITGFNINNEKIYNINNTNYHALTA